MPLSLAMRKAVLRVLTETHIDGKRMSTSELARRTELKDSSVRRRIDGKIAMDPDTFEAIAVALGSDVDTMWSLARTIQDTETESGPLPKLTPEMRDELSERLAADLNDPEVDAARAAFFADQERKKRSR